AQAALTSVSLPPVACAHSSATQRRGRIVLSNAVASTPIDSAPEHLIWEVSRVAATAWPPSARTVFLGRYLQAIARCRTGRSPHSAMNAARMLRIAAITKTAVQLPVQLVSTLPSGTSSAAVPFAVYNRP